MGVDKLIFRDAEKERDMIWKTQQREISNLYLQWSKEVSSKAKNYSKKEPPSYAVKERQMKTLEKQLVATSSNIHKQIENKIQKNMYLTAESVAKSNVNWLSSLGFNKDVLNVAFSSVPENTVEKLVTGKIYENKWNLSKSIWGDSQKTQSDIYKVVAGGLAQNKSTYDIAKDLEKYVSPGEKKKWNIKDEDGRRIYPRQVDYSAQRLARTLSQHAYQQSVIDSTMDNPFINSIKWDANGPRRCQICIERDGRIYKKKDLPLDHPNGFCVMIPVVDEDLVDQLSDWFNRPDGTYPKIDKFARGLGYKGVTDINMNKFNKTFEKKNPEINKLVKTALTGASLFVQDRFANALVSLARVNKSDIGSYFSKEKNIINIDTYLLDKEDRHVETIFHEFGHVVDFNLQEVSASKEVLAALEKDIESLNSLKNFDLLKRIIEDDGNSAIHDIVSGLQSIEIFTETPLYNLVPLYSHSRAYWRRDRYKNDGLLKKVSSELFAGCFSNLVSTNATERKNLEKIFPNYHKVFIEIIKGV